MIKHLVLFKMADEAEGNDKAENILLVKELLESLKGVIPVIRKMDVYTNYPGAHAGNYDIVLDSEFDSPEELKTYSEHPAHLKAGEFILKVSTERAAIDYEI